MADDTDARGTLIGAFLAEAGWSGAARAPLAGDASARRYLRLTAPGGHSAVLMDAPPGPEGQTEAFATVAAHLRMLGLSAPAILAARPADGLLLLEDLGDALYPRVLAAEPGSEPRLYAAATDLLVRLQAHPPLAGLPAYDIPAMAAAIEPASSWYAHAVNGAAADHPALSDALGSILARYAAAPPVMVLRDFHAANLIWLPGRKGIARVGLLDFQDAMLSHPALDLVSICQDARRDIPPDIETAMIRRFAAAAGHEEGPFRRAYALIGAQRHLRLLGIVTRLALRDGKPGYLVHLPRIWRDLQRDLARPETARLAGLVARHLPPPTPATIERIARQCPSPMPPGTNH